MAYMADFVSLQAIFKQLVERVSQIVVGRDEAVEQFLVTVLAGEHLLLEGNPGSGRTWLTQLLARSLGLSFRQLGCTSETTAEELVGLSNVESGPGLPALVPITANVLFVDDIERLGPRTRAVLDDGLSQNEVVVAGRKFTLAEPFVLVAAKYPRVDEQAELAFDPRYDRFFCKISMRFPTYFDEFQFAASARTPRDLPDEPLLTAADLASWRKAVETVEIPPAVTHYVLRLVRATRVHEGENPDFIYEWVASGASPRSARQLIQAARNRAALHGRTAASSADIKALAPALLRHRIVVNANAITNGITPDRVIQRLLYEIPLRVAGDDREPQPGDSLSFDLAADGEWVE